MGAEELCRVTLDGMREMLAIETPRLVAGRAAGLSPASQQGVGTHS